MTAEPKLAPILENEAFETSLRDPAEHGGGAVSNTRATAASRTLRPQSELARRRHTLRTSSSP